ncbi:MAG: CHC2 zinc finger domain-containing protein [Clostridiales bacterium]|nr:CHC2 zinc finger domain-containing protein [Clostridiales bacterium]MCD8368684.1 CHC2 zinc finger domain-containing protein [Clostridiales bacterium]
MNVFEAVKQFVTTRQAAETYGIRVNRNGMCICPFHNDRNPSMKVDRRFHCFGCQADGDVIDFTAKLFGINSKGTAVKLTADFGIPYDADRHGGTRTRAAPVRSRLSQVQQTRRDESRCFRTYCDYFHLLEDWKTMYQPRTPEEEPDRRFIEACHRLDYVRYVLDDILLTGTEAERAEFVETHREEVKRIEQRIAASAIYGAAASIGDGDHDGVVRHGVPAQGASDRRTALQRNLPV